MDLSDVIASFATGTYVVTRRDRTAYVSGGYATPGAVLSTFAIEACVQPVTGNTLERLAAAFDSSDICQIWSPIRLMTLDDGNTADTLVIDGGTWQVQRCESWDTLGAYWRAYLTKVNT